VKGKEQWEIRNKLGLVCWETQFCDEVIKYDSFDWSWEASGNASIIEYSDSRVIYGNGSVHTLAVI
jgi:hypothetical protein